ncbi:hypothetical protein [Clostridium sp. Marseille-P299]|uniref:hypothetical protein n=1 Tax=Clostridium sp. Marseille-P299 TaxID=1805477 RepID=UPI00082E5DC0|nr:hypothetical protein [Clostridium sp. Marseille-P299]
MNNVIEKLGSYQIMTNLLPGAFFGMALRFLFELSLPTENIGEEILVFYFMGFVINRIGSLIINPILEKMKFIQEAPYPDYLKAVKVDAKLDILSETNNYFRSTLTCFVLLPIVGLMHSLITNVSWVEKCWSGCAIMFFIVLFLFSYRKQTDIVRRRTEAINNQQKVVKKDK